MQLLIAIVTGLVAGLIHVWSGPDHLAAIAPLAVRRPQKSWAPGLRWGLGHSAGVGVIGLLSLWLRDLIPVKLVSSWGERLVGLMLLAIGFWALRKALGVHTHEHEHDGERHMHMHAHAASHRHDQAQAHRHTHAAFGIGILHGLAGSSHFLGVLPALAFPTGAQAVSYLAAFAAGTVASMSAFSWVIGLVASRCEVQGVKVYRGLMTVCAAAAMGVGCFWLLW